MGYTPTQARELVIAAGHRLIAAGLIARTWGNISARISDTQFVITPSGLAYETLEPRQLVTVDIADCAYTGTIKPSSEKGIHADVYRLRPDVHFVIHTHQENASVAGILGTDLTGCENELLGPCVPCADYGLSSTKKLRRAVTAAAAKHPDSTAVLMRYHGALCMGKSDQDAFAIAAALETVCGARIGPAVQVAPVADLGSSDRQGSSFRLCYGGAEAVYDLNAMPPDASAVAALHAQVYQKSDVRAILFEGGPAAAAVSARGKTMLPYLDDLAQIAGASIRCVPPDPAAVVKGLKGRNAVLLRGAGAFCTGICRADAEAARIILQKGCQAQLFADQNPGCRPVGALDALIERTIYVKKYAKRKQ